MNVARLPALLRAWAVAPRIPASEGWAERRALVTLLYGRSAADHAVLAGVDVARLVELAERFAVLVPLADALLAPQHRATLDAALAERLDERRVGARLQNQLLLADARHLGRALDDAELPYVILKGAALLARCPALAARHTDDVDVLVGLEDAAAVERVLSARGFVVRESGRARHPLVATAPEGTLVEVHFGLEDGLDHGAWARAERVDVAGTALSLPSMRDLARHLAHHVLVQHAGSPRYLPRHLLDVAGLRAAGVAQVEGDVDRTVEASFELADLAAEAARSPNGAALFGALLFPTHHSALHLAVAKRLRRGLRGGARGIGAELRRLGRLRAYLWYDVE